MASPPTIPAAEDSKMSPAEQSVPPGCGGGFSVTRTFAQAPFFALQISKPHQILDGATGLVRKIDCSIATAMEKCLKLACLLAAQNPLVKKLSCLSSDLNTLRQMQCGNYKKLSSLSSHNFAAILPGDSVAGVVVTNGILNFLNIYNNLLIVRLVLTWFPSAPPAIVNPLSTLCDPYLNIFRGLIPPLGGTLDLSPILAFLLLNVFTSAAAALPAELPPAGALQHNTPKTEIFNLTSSQKKWIRRLHGNASQNSSKSK